MSSSSAHLLLHILDGRLDGLRCGGAEEMEVEIWQRLPADLFRRILLNLPPRNLVRFSILSKSLRLLLASEDFRKQHEETLRQRNKPPCGIPLCGIEYCPVGTNPLDVTDAPYSCPATEQVVEVDPGLQTIAVDLVFLPHQYRCCNHFAAQDGLVCVWTHRRRHWRFCIFNPLTRDYKALRLRSKISQATLKVYICVTEPAGCAYGLFPLHFLVLVVREPGKGGTVLYSSLTDKWEAVKGDNERVRQVEFQPLLSATQLVSAYDECREGCYRRFFLNAQGRVDPDPDGHLPRNINFMFNPFLVEHRGHILSIQHEPLKFGKEDDQDPKQVTIWKLNKPAPGSNYAHGSLLDEYLLWNLITSFRPSSSIDVGGVPILNEPDLDSQGSALTGFHHRVEGALVTGDAVYISVEVRRPDPNGGWKEFAWLVYRYHMLAGTWKVVTERLLHSGLGPCKLFMPRL